jgi:hypothetical protein
VLLPASGPLYSESLSLALLNERPGMADFERLRALAERVSELVPQQAPPRRAAELRALLRRAAAGSSMEAPPTAQLYVGPAAEGSAAAALAAGQEGQEAYPGGGAGGQEGQAAAAGAALLGGKPLRRLATRVAELLLPGQPAAAQAALHQQLLPLVLQWCDRLPGLANHPASHLIAVASSLMTCADLVGASLCRLHVLPATCGPVLHPPLLLHGPSRSPQMTQRPAFAAGSCCAGELGAPAQLVGVPAAGGAAAGGHASAGGQRSSRGP